VADPWEVQAMTTVRASEARIPIDTFNRVASGERVRVRHRGRRSICLVPEDDLRRLEEIEDRRDARADSSGGSNGANER
jgi:hypothetical protein